MAFGEKKLKYAFVQLTGTRYTHEQPKSSFSFLRTAIAIVLHASTCNFQAWRYAKKPMI